MTPAEEIRAIEDLWALQREYRKRRDASLVVRALQLSRSAGFDMPPWVEHGLQASTDRRKTESEAIADAFGFLPGDFAQAEYDDAMYRRWERLKATKDEP